MSRPPGSSPEDGSPSPHRPCEGFFAYPKAPSRHRSQVVCVALRARLDEAALLAEGAPLGQWREDQPAKAQGPQRVEPQRAADATSEEPQLGGMTPPSDRAPSA